MKARNPLPPAGVSNIKLQPVKPVTSGMPMPAVKPPAPTASRSNWQKFKSWLADNRVLSGSLANLSRLEILNKYKDYLMAGSKAFEAIGYGKKMRKHMKMIKNPDKLCSCIAQHGGSWSDFVGWIKDRANDVADVGRKIGSTIRNVGNTVYKRGIRPGLEYMRDHPLSTLGGIAKVGSYLPIPGVSQALGTAGTVLGTAGSLLGKGQEGGARKHPTSGKVMLVMP